MFSNQLNRQIPITSKGDVWIVSVVDILRFNLKAYLIYPVISLKVEKYDIKTSHLNLGPMLSDYQQPAELIATEADKKKQKYLLQMELDMIAAPKAGAALKNLPQIRLMPLATFGVPVTPFLAVAASATPLGICMKMGKNYQGIAKQRNAFHRL